MTVPDYQTLMAPVLQVLADGHERPIADLRNRVARQLSLSEEDLRLVIPSGATMFASRLQWAVAYMFQADLLRRPRRGVVQITDRGQQVLTKHADRIDLNVLRQFEEFVDFQTRSRKSPKGVLSADPSSDTTPGETIAAAIEEANAAVATEVLARVRDQDPVFLERVALNVLTALGYGGARGTAQHTGRTGDKGLDGVIHQDPLGLDRIFVQAKRYAAGSSGAIDYADRVSSRLILIDGPMLADLMVRYDIGVQTHETYTIKRIDEDFFEESA
jgi:restriction system protein